MGEKSPKIYERKFCFHVLFQIHWPDQATPIAELVSTMDELVRSGKVRYVGAGNVSGWQLQKMWILPTNLDATLGFLCR